MTPSMKLTRTEVQRVASVVAMLAERARGRRDHAVASVGHDTLDHAVAGVGHDTLDRILRRPAALKVTRATLEAIAKETGPEATVEQLLGGHLAPTQAAPARPSRARASGVVVRRRRAA